MLVTRQIIHGIYEESNHYGQDDIHIFSLIRFPMFSSSRGISSIRFHCVVFRNGDLCFNTYYPLSEISHGIYNIYSFSKLLRWW